MLLPQNKVIFKKKRACFPYGAIKICMDLMRSLRYTSRNCLTNIINNNLFLCDLRIEKIVIHYKKINKNKTQCYKLYTKYEKELFALGKDVYLCQKQLLNYSNKLPNQIDYYILFFIIMIVSERC